MFQQAPPTMQEFFAKDMGLALTMTPNYEDLSCQFSFGKTPAPQAQDEAFATPCFAACPSRNPASQQGNRCRRVALEEGT